MIMVAHSVGMGASEAGAPVAPGPGRELMLLYVGRVVVLGLCKALIDLLQLGAPWHA